MITYLNTDIFTSTADTLVCPVNTVGVMGAGLAREFRRRYLGLYPGYSRACKRGDIDIGKLWTWYTRNGEGRGIENESVLCFPSKKNWQDRSKIEYIIAGLKAFRRTHTPQSYAFPKLGCGCGGLSWIIVRPELERYLGDLPIRVDVHI